jgi:hypothetical protein
MTGISKLSSSLLLAIILIFLFFSCSSKVKSIKGKAYKYASMKDEVLHLDLDKSRKDSVIINLSDLCDSLIYIPLETQKECLLGSWLVEFFIDGNDIFMQVDRSAYHFKQSGEFVCQYGRLGRGAKEYSCSGLALNTNDKRVYAKADFKRRLLEFDYDGRLISSKIKMADNQYMMMYSPIEKELIYSSNYSLSKDKKIKTDYNILSAYDLNGKIKYNIKTLLYLILFLTIMILESLLHQHFLILMKTQIFVG